MPFINNVHPSSWPKAVKKLKLVPTDSIASNGSFYGHVYGSKADSGIVDEHASGMSVGYGETIKICPFEFCKLYFQMALLVTLNYKKGRVENVHIACLLMF